MRKYISLSILESLVEKLGTIAKQGKKHFFLVFDVVAFDRCQVIKHLINICRSCCFTLQATFRALKTSGESVGLRVGVFLGEEPLGEPCFPHSVVESSPYRPVQEVASSLSLLGQEALVLLEPSPPLTVVAQEIFLGNRVLLVEAQSLLQSVQAPLVLTLLSPQISGRDLARAAESHLEGHAV